MVYRSPKFSKNIGFEILRRFGDPSMIPNRRRFELIFQGLRWKKSHRPRPGMLPGSRSAIGKLYKDVPDNFGWTHFPIKVLV